MATAATESESEVIIGSLSKAFSGGGGIGVDEKTMISVLGKLHPQEKEGLRRGGWRDLFVEDERQFPRWEERCILHLEKEFLRLKDVIVLWTMHPWERDARLLKESLHDARLGSGEEPRYDLLIEVACTRSSDELLGARRAYHSLCHRSVEEDVADSRIPIPNQERKLLVALLSSYRYQGPKVDQETAKAEAKAILAAIKGKWQGNAQDEVGRILSTRSKAHLQAMYKYYKEISGNYLDEDVDGHLRQTVECLCAPHKYFTKILCASMEGDSNETAKQGLSRVIVSRADLDMDLIKKEYNEKCGVHLSTRIEQVANGNYRDFLLALIARS